MLYLKKYFSFHFQSFILIFVIALTTISCSKTPDVRLTLCQDLTVLFLNAPETIEWKEHKPIMNGLDDLEMQISFSLNNSDVQTIQKASCFYKHEQEDIEAETFNAPTSAYSAYPNKMIVDGKVVKKKVLADGVNQVMLVQGKRAIINTQEKVKEGIETINKEVQERLDK
ncbi:MAG: hypothetical protein OQL19_00125 [Gammaproteobacteria bacterium]|nr:hypothetical protein [Gammaproteobacteria bacterium]